MIQSVELSPAEALLLQKGEDAFQQATAHAQSEFETVVKAIYVSKGFEWGATKGSFQRDPLDRNVVRFVYDDGKVDA